jgi:hypothetical protein
MRPIKTLPIILAMAVPVMNSRLISSIQVAYDGPKMPPIDQINKYVYIYMRRRRMMICIGRNQERKGERGGHSKESTARRNETKIRKKETSFFSQRERERESIFPILVEKGMTKEPTNQPKTSSVYSSVRNVTHCRTNI